MSILFEERPSDSPYVETVIQGYTVADGPAERPAESHWHMVLARVEGRSHLVVVGPWSAAGVVPYTAGAELLWIKFRLGVFMPHLPVRSYLNLETTLPQASDRSFWLKSSTWQYPNFENVETFIDRLARQEVLACDPVVSAVLQAQPQTQRLAWPERTVRDRFLRATGLPQRGILQMQRAQRAADLLSQGVSILDTVQAAGYFDQPHLTRSLKRFIGKTPAQILQQS